MEEQVIHRVNIVGSISHFFTTNRPLTTLVLIVTLVFGLVAFLLTPKQYNPEIVRPAFLITINYQGATTEAAIDRVVYELVEKVDTVPGVDDIYTEVHDGAEINTTVIFEVGYDATKAKLDLLSQIDQHSYLARGNIAHPSVIEINPETIPVLQIAFGSEKLALGELRSRVVTLGHELNDIENVSEILVYGGYPDSVVVEVDPHLLAAHNVTPETVSQALATSQSRAVLRGFPGRSVDTEVVFEGVQNDTEAIGNISINSTTKVRDVAAVYVGAHPERSYVFYKDQQQRGEVVLLSVAKREGSSGPVVTEAVKDELAALVATPEFAALSYHVVSDDGVTASDEIYGLTQNLITSIVIVAGVLLLFLSLRAAFAVLVAIPVTLLVVFGLGFVFDQTINRITLFALILSLGLLVDSAIVVVENIYSHLKAWAKEPDHRTRAQVVAKAVDEVGVGLLLSTITSVIVFLPMLYITGMMGPYMGPIAFFVPAALIVALLVAIVITPFVTAYVIQPEEVPNRLTRMVDAVVQKVTKQYQHYLAKIMRSRKLQRRLLLGALSLFIASLILPAFGLVHFQMLPRADRDQFYMYVDFPVDTNIEETRRLTDQLSEVLLADEDVISMQESIGVAPIIDFNGMFKGVQGRTNPHQSTVRVNLVATHERDRSSTDVVTAVRAAVESTLPQLAPYVRFMEEPPGPPVRATFVAKVTTSDDELRNQVAADLLWLIGGTNGVVDTYVSDEASVGRMVLAFNDEAGEQFGVSPAMVMTTLRLVSGSVEVAESVGSQSAEYTPIIMSLPYSERSTPAALDTLLVTNDQGEQTPLRSLVHVSYEPRPSRIHLEDASAVTYVTAEVEGRSIVYVVIELMHDLITGELPHYTVTEWGLFGLTLETQTGGTLSINWGGEWEMTLENFRDLGIAMLVSLFMVYAVLVAQYKRFDAPAYILVTVPLGLVGILSGFFILDVFFGIYLTATALIGFIALIGLVVNNAIIYLEYVEQERAAGHMYRDALVAAGKARLRPIFLTSLTTILGSLTIAGDPVWSGLAWAIVFGLSLSTILTLVVYPTLLAYFVSHKVE